MRGTWLDWCLAGGRPARARLRRWRRTARSIIALSETLRTLSDSELRDRSEALKWQARTDVPLEQLLVEAYAVIRESSRRTIGQSHYPVQIVAAIALFEGFVVEMQTGEGKTLTATMPAYLRALQGRGCHVVTSNDYLAFRDAKLNHRIFERLGVTCACVIAPLEDEQRREAYAQDITYGTVRELGFDFLRDRLRRGAGDEASGASERYFQPDLAGSPPVQRGHAFALVDEADSVLIDEARTPLVIGLARPVDPVTLARVRWSERVAGQLAVNEDFEFDSQKRQAVLRAQGCRKVLLFARPSLLAGVASEPLYRSVERALVARHGFHRGRDYLVIDGKVVIVDESTGRTMEGRKWQEELHQAIEAKEHLPITATTGSAARITVQSYFRRYKHLCGMTGTALLARGEFRSTYHLRVARIPTHRPSLRTYWPTRVFSTLEAKWAAVAEEVRRLTTLGRPVLVGTPSVAASQALSEVLRNEGIDHQVLNALYHEQEADIVQHAGEEARVTIATNMAGRGTDILLNDPVRECGGLHVIATELHSSARIDRQLVGRCARQGDPGSCQFLLSVEDELFRVVPLPGWVRWKEEARRRANARGELPSSWARRFHLVQQRLEASHRRQRHLLLKREFEQQRSCEKLGLDPWLELVD